MLFLGVLGSIVLGSLSSPWAQNNRPYSPEKLGFSVKVKSLIVSYKLMSVFVLPGETTDITVSEDSSFYQLKVSTGNVKAVSSTGWAIKAPNKPGIYSIEIFNYRSKERMVINQVVLYSMASIKNGRINGFYIGQYPEASAQNPLSIPPQGFIEVTPENINTPLTPHFTLGQFISKQDGGFPKYVVVTEKLLLKLETVLEVANAHGYTCHSFTVMSGYRTPYINKAIGNETTFSRHLWGLAADIYIDEAPRDGVMDDINHDGKIDKKDTELLYSLVDQLDTQSPFSFLQGGLANYKATSSHGPFVHVDARGFKARWNG